ncbi:MAG: 16S rRNA (cytosine(967)-C(5))-methyltransferase RsmB [Thioploca sp.]|nr:16S rRNA (cytosine(967)-C(5))-methyltransferase RsmB [Thioploca sp.]
MDARSVATQILTQVIRERRSLSHCLETQLPLLKDSRERALTQELCYGVLRWLPRLQALLKDLLRKPLKTKDDDIQVLLLIGLYQHLYLQIPPYAATAATVEVTRTLKKDWASGLVNAVLRHFQRQRQQLLEQIDTNLSVKFAHPPWLLDRLQTNWPHHWESLLRANNSHPPLTLRINARCLSRETYLTHLQQANIVAELTPYTDYGVTIQQWPVTLGLEEQLDLLKSTPAKIGNWITHLPGFSQGWISVQDGAAQLAAPLLDVPAGARVLDACAAPGGKTAHLLEHYNNSGTLFALDNQPARIKKLEETLQRLQLTATIRCADATQPHTWWDGNPFERILLDAPCSGSGVIRRHPDIKYLRQPHDMAALTDQQQGLLKALWPLLKPGGKLLYVTCSVFAEENELQIEKFLTTQHDAEESRLMVQWGHALSRGRQILSGENNTDGFYYACLTKTI